MLNAFRKVRVRCCVCNTPTDERYKRGTKYYCADDYSRLDDKIADRKTRIADKRFKKLMTNAQ